MPERADALGLCRAEIRSLPAYHAGISESTARARYGLTRVTKLSSNENPLGPSPDVAEQLRNCISGIFRYPDPHCAELREEIQRRTGVEGSRIVLGNGSEDIIEMLCKAFLAPGDRVLTLAPSFGLHEIFPLMMGATVDKVAVSPNFDFDLCAWAEALRRPAKLLMFSTPSNPVGCVLSDYGLRTLIAASPPDVVLVIDEAYHEYAVGPGYADSLTALAGQRRPWIVLRTLSKAYGLAGLRVGYGLASDQGLVSLLEKVRTPFNVNHAAQVAAVAALRDGDHMRAVVSATVRERQSLIARLRELESTGGYGLKVAPSFGNFLFIDTRRPSREIATALMSKGVIVKPWLDTGYETFIRVTIGRSAENEHFMEALTAALTPAEVA